MYHRLNRVDCPPLEKLNEIARLTILFALERQDCDDEEVIRKNFKKLFHGEWFSLCTRICPALVNGYGQSM